MRDLLRKILNIKQDYVKIINANLGENAINEFFKKVNEKRGRIVNIRSSLGIEGHTSLVDDRYSGNPSNPGQELSIYSDNSFIIHYKCYEEIG